MTTKRKPEDWENRTGISILDPDGWDRRSFTDWERPITREEFLQRAARSTVAAWPNPLADEPVSHA